MPPHRNTIQRHLKQLECEYKLLLIKELSNIHSLGINGDFWNGQRLYSYICLSQHHASSNNEYILKILAFTWFHHRHFSFNISMIIKKELNELNILEKTHSTATNGAA